MWERKGKGRVVRENDQKVKGTCGHENVFRKRRGKVDGVQVLEGVMKNKKMLGFSREELQGVSKEVCWGKGGDKAGGTRRTWETVP